MKFAVTYNYISKTVIDSALWKMECYLMDRYGITQAWRDMDPLKWYINSGRASYQFMGKMMEKKPYMIARKLHEGGSYDDAIKRVKDYIGFVAYEDMNEVERC